MTLEEMIGARLAIGFHGTEATTELIQALQDVYAQTLVVFSRNFASPEQFTRLITDLQDALQRRLLVMVDHEGGRVIRFASGVTRFPAARLIGRTLSPESVRRQGETEAEELKRLGVRVNLAPCVDVLVEGSDPIIGDRAYGSDPALVSRFGVARIQGLQSHGVAACAKHFPGLGAVPNDPHRVLPTIGLGWDAMERVHLVPFRAAIEAGVAMVMSSHVCYPGLGEPPELPATFSPRLVKALLRDRLGFQGLILSDDLEMGALQHVGGMGEVTVRASEAGHDLLLICSDLAAAKEALSSLRQAYRSGRLSEAELASTMDRVAAVRKIFLA
ncbi:MAG: beta-N-acetylhexosaminidase [Candidatus Omnitrophica bacterium CG11_big_fil_rev_8_21_14_0_20_63_9]|nr:MAG: beta-N-acetylhexosaminidase [Candidatus Omnitrophica bacterium CG11_big_fil_rev_8_21_14_0_20_63_9]